MNRWKIIPDDSAAEKEAEKRRQEIRDRTKINFPSLVALECHTFAIDQFDQAIDALEASKEVEKWIPLAFWAAFKEAILYPEVEGLEYNLVVLALSEAEFVRLDILKDEFRVKVIDFTGGGRSTEIVLKRSTT